MRIGVMVPRPGADALAWLALARRFEVAGFDFLALPDHYGQGPSPIPALAAIGAGTTKLGLVPLALNCGKREVGALVEDIATLSSGFGERVRIGLGVGWHAADWSAHGVAMAPFEARMESLERVATRLRSGLERAASYSPKHRSIRPPLIIAGAGDRVLSFAAAHADMVNLGPDLSRGTFDAQSVVMSSRAATIARCELIARSAAEAGRRVPIQLLVLQLLLTKNAQSGYEEIARTYSTTADLTRGAPHYLAGTPDEVGAKLEYWIWRHNVTELVVNQVDLDHPVDQLVEFVSAMHEVT